MVTAIRTIVEGGTETDLHATTTTAYLGEYVAFVTVVTDPGTALQSCRRISRRLF